MAETGMSAIPSQCSKIDKTLYELIKKCKCMRERNHKVTGGGVGGLRQTICSSPLPAFAALIQRIPCLTDGEKRALCKVQVGFSMKA